MCGAMQATLFGRGEARIDPAFTGMVRIPLGRGAWVEHRRGWLEGHEEVFETLLAGTRWRRQRRRMYERIVDVPRLIASIPEDGPGHEILPLMAAALSSRYGLGLERISIACYRDGRDSVAWHGDRLGPHRDDTVVAIVSVGARRRFLLRPAGGGPSMAFTPGWGDLLVMGGACQRTWEHTVPKVSHAEPRISIQFRVAVDEDTPEMWRVEEQASGIPGS